MYVELDAQSAFSFLEAASQPEDLVVRAAELGYPALALADTNGVYGAPRFYKAAKEHGLKPIVGARVDVEGARVTLLVASRQGYQNLCRLLTAGAAGRPKGEPRFTLEALEYHADGLYALTRSASLLPRLAPLFGGRAYAALERHYCRAQERRNRALKHLAESLKVPLLAVNGVRYAKPHRKAVYDVLACIRLGKTLETAGRLLEPHRERHLKAPAVMEALFADVPEAVKNTEALAGRLDFTLDQLGYRFPDFALPAGETPDSWLAALTWRAAPSRFPELTPRVRAQLERELALIAKLKLAGYFLTIHGIVEYCRKERILVQGRGSAANSAVCYALGITAVDPIKMDLLFERFLSEERGEWPDIDLDLPSGDQREKVIQHLYAKHGGGCSAMTANVITYRPKSAMRELAKVLGYPPERVDALSKWAGTLDWDELRKQDAFAAAVKDGGLGDTEEGRRLIRLWLGMQGLPRHLGQHSGGMVLAGGRLDDVVPMEPASMPGRTVIQWDKEDCADLGLIKVDLLGLGMLDAIEQALPMIERNEGVKVDLARLPPDDPKVYRMLNAADTVGVFQLESRAQMATLPRNGPRNFYDIVVQVAIIRPGPIVGGMVRPFFERRQGKRPVEYPHPSLEPVLKRTLGVPLFQEQVLRMAMVAAGFTGGQAEELRRAMGFKRSVERMDRIEEALRRGMAAKGIKSATQEEIVALITAFAQYGFPESHAASFALIAYASSYLKAHHPTAFYAALLNAWPMGFYHPATLVQDAHRHGIRASPIDVSLSGVDCRWEAKDAFRLGLRFVKGLPADAMRRIEAGQKDGPYRDGGDLARRASLNEDALERLAYAGALGSMGLSRRASLWQVSQVARNPGPLFEEQPLGADSPLPEMTPQEETLADYRSAELTTGPHVLAHHRGELKGRGVLTTAELAAGKDGAWVRMAGSVIVRQRPQTAKGFLFLTLEDETGLAQAIIHPKLFKRRRSVIVGSPALIVDGILQKEEGTLSVRAARVEPFACGALPSHDFH